MLAVSRNVAAAMLTQSQPSDSGGDWSSVATVFISLAAFFVSFLALWCSWRWRQQVARPEQIANVPKALRDDYLSESFPGDQEDERVEIRDYRLVARERVDADDACTNAECGAREGKCGYCAFVERSTASDHKPCTPIENRFCYALSLALEDVGHMALVGALPLDVVVSRAAPLIVEDWGYCRHLVQKIRGAWGAKGSPIGSWERRHGEWLACVAAMYLAVWGAEVPRVKKLLERAGGIERLVVREEELFAREERLLATLSPSAKTFTRKLRKRLGDLGLLSAYSAQRDSASTDRTKRESCGSRAHDETPTPT